MEEWKKRVKFATDLVIEEQEKFDERYDLSKYEEYTFDLKTGDIVFSKEGESLFVKSQVVGSIYQPKEGVSVWVWSWDNNNISNEAKNEMQKMKSFGKESDFLAINNSFWEAEEMDALQMASVTLSIIDGQSIYCCNVMQNDYYVVIKSATVESKKKLKRKNKM